MNCRNTVTLIGHLGQDCEVFKFDSGSQKARFTLATSERYANAKGEMVTSTDWHKCEAWGKPVDTMEKYFKKGKELAIQGSLHTENYTDRDGNKRSRTFVRVNSFAFIGKKQEA